MPQGLCVNQVILFWTGQFARTVQKYQLIATHKLLELIFPINFLQRTFIFNKELWPKSAKSEMNHNITNFDLKQKHMKKTKVPDVFYEINYETHEALRLMYKDSTINGST